MTRSSLLLAFSLAANVAFAAVLFVRFTGSDSPPPTADSSLATTDARDRGTAALRAALASGDAAALEAAGVPASIARELALGRRFARLEAAIRAAQASQSSGDRWWRNRPGTNPASREAQLAARRELSDALMAAFGHDLAIGGDSSPYAFLPTTKRDALRRIVQDYDEMIAKFSAGGIQLPSDREKLRLLRLERERDIAALLSPDELAAYELRTSPSSAVVRSRYGDAIESEAEFRKLFELQKSLDEKFPREALTGRIAPETLRARAEAERQLDADMRAALGDERYAALRRAADPDVRNVDSLAQRLGLPGTTTDGVLAARDSYSTASQRIAADASLSVPERRSQIQALAAQARSDLTQALGAEAAEAYAQRAPWLSLLQGGMAYSTTPTENSPGSFFGGAAPSVYPVPPAGTTGAGQRQVMFSTAAPVEVTTAGGGVPGGDVQVLSFSSSTVTTTDRPASTEPAAVRRVGPAEPVRTPPSAGPTPDGPR